MGVKSGEDLEDTKLGLKFAALVGQSFWASCTASGDVAPLLKEYVTVAEALCGLTSHALLQQPAFADMAEAIKKARGGVPPLSDMKQWVDQLPEQLESWLDSSLLVKVKEQLLQTCKAEVEQQFSAGLDGVAAFVQRVVSQGSQGFDADGKNKLLLGIPNGHPLNQLVRSFIQAGVFVMCVGPSVGIRFRVDASFPPQEPPRG